MWLDITDSKYGAVADDKTNCSPAIQRAVDDAINRKWKFGNKGGATIYIPPANLPYLLHSPICIDEPGIEIVGGGRGSVLHCHPYFESPALVFGVSRKAGEASYRPEAKDIYDSSVSDKKYYIKTNGNACLILQPHTLQLGPYGEFGRGRPSYWKTVRNLTIDFLLEKPDNANWEMWRPIFGVGGPLGKASPWFVTTGQNPEYEIALNIRSSKLTHPEHAHTFIISTKGFSGPLRITYQLDMDKGKVEAWINGQAVDVILFNVTDHEWSPGLELAETDGTSPFLIGSSGTLVRGAEVIDFNLYGLSVTEDLLYTGKIQKRIDNPSASINDQYRYFTNRPKLIGNFPLDRSTWTVKVNSAFFPGVAFWIKTKQPLYGKAFNKVKDLTIFAAGQPGIVLGEVLEFEADHVEVFGGLQGIGSLNIAANYKIYLNRCNLSGSDCGYYGHRQDIVGTSNYFGEIGKDGIRLKGCGSVWNDTIFASTNQNTDRIFSLITDEYGGIHSIERLMIDNEAHRLKKCAIYCEQHRYTLTTLNVKLLNIAYAGKGVAIIDLKGFGYSDSLKVATVNVEDIICWSGDQEKDIRMSGEGWKIGRYNGDKI